MRTLSKEFICPKMDNKRYSNPLMIELLECSQALIDDIGYCERMALCNGCMYLKTCEAYLRERRKEDEQRERF